MPAEETKTPDITNPNRTKYNILSAIGDAPWILIYPIAYIIAKTGGQTTDDFNSFIEEYNIEMQLYHILSQVRDKWDIVNELSKTCSAEACKFLLLYDDSLSQTERFEETPSGVNLLAAKLMNISSGKKVADLCTGTLSFIRQCISLGLNCNYLGSEIDSKALSIAMLRADILGNVTITSEDSLKISGKYDYVFCHSPFGLKWRYYYPDCRHSASADWLFAKKCVELLDNGGKAVCIMTNGSTRNNCDKQMRERFIKLGYIETIIALPEKIYSNTAISSTLMVFSKENKSVNFIDASDNFLRTRRTNILSDENILQILSVVGKNTPISYVARNEEIADNDYELYPKNYTEKQPDIPNAVLFSDLITRITRGAQIKANELDTLVCESETDTRLLMLSDMSKGIISDKLPYLSKIEKRYEKYCANDGDIILSKNGYPVKTAVTNISGNEKILVNGNLYIIEIDKSRIEPYYLKAYFDSEKGQAQLKSICVGVTLPNIPIEALKKLQIPMCPLSEQKIIADKYLKKQQEVIDLQKKLDTIEQELKEFF
ncbi:N-6 DNA methylase [Ruminococcus flavefaciens]|uniref:site-specific DNA-methyltransferase (adenine-specific) n=1 Tax=Ruminococcus flavefaciens TaxID=1265 RepID=A0A1K1MK42_RUMFL|nr:N-6 DNA methylase [Ruminococcus flavefaciens]SFW22310.1 type I restriction enzyme M protein [Ruminococcus flavefaciens]